VKNPGGPRQHQSSARRLLRPTVIAQIVAIGAIILVGASVARSKQESQIGTTPLGVGSRDRLAICIQPAEGLTLGRDEAVAAAQAAFTELEKNPNWAVYAPYAVGGPRIDMDCPGQPSLFRPILGQYPPNRPIHIRETVAATAVDTPSPYRAFIVVMPDRRLSEVLVGELRGRRSTEETVCGDSGCAEVTVGMYVSRSEFVDSSALSNALAIALGMSNPVTEGRPSPSPDYLIGDENSTPLPRAPKPERTLTPKEIEDFGSFRR